MRCSGPGVRDIGQGLSASLIDFREALASVPEAVHRIVGNEIKRLVERKDQRAKHADALPSLAKWAPVKDLVTVISFLGSQPGDGVPPLFEVERIPPRILAHANPAAAVFVVQLDPMQHKIHDDSLTILDRPPCTASGGLFSLLSCGFLGFHACLPAGRIDPLGLRGGKCATCIFGFGIAHSIIGDDDPRPAAFSRVF